jgi:hypothetical protein
MKSKYGVDVAYFKKKLECVIRDLDSYTPQELSRELESLADTAFDGEVEG